MSQRLLPSLLCISIPWSFLLALFLLTSCANEGVIVRKDAGPLPFYESLGVDGSYAFLLRDNAGSMHRQLVTPEVFERYAVGQYFNDLQPVGNADVQFQGGQDGKRPGRAKSQQAGRFSAHAQGAKNSERQESNAYAAFCGKGPQVPEDNREADAQPIGGRKLSALRKRTSAKVKPSRQMLLVKVDRNR